MKWSGTIAHMGKMRNANNTDTKLEALKPSGRTRSRWVNNIRTNLRYEDMEWIHLAQDSIQQEALLNTV
jgi:hypothetical protein